MCPIKRAFLSIKRYIGKSILLFLLVIGLGVLMSSAIVFNRSIDQARDNLWRGLPPIVVIDIDFQALNEAVEAGDLLGHERFFLTADIIESIGNLPYVRSFDIFEGTTIYSRELERVLLDFSIESDFQSFDGQPIVMMELHGITNPTVISIETGLRELVSGRTFTLEEMSPINPNESVAMISEQLAVLNGLEVGDSIILENNFFKYRLMDYHHYWGNFADDYIVNYEHYVLEIVGTFDPVVIPDFGSPMQEVYANNGILVPLTVVHSIIDFIEENQVEDMRSHGFHMDWPGASEFPHRNIIVLNDASDLPSFINAAEEFLPPYHKVATFSNSVLAIERFDDSMTPFQDLSAQIVWTMMGVTIVVLALVILLFLRDRRSEIGIYLALGERKGRIVKQIFLEVMIPSVVGILVALFLGQLVASSIGREMLANEVIAGQDFYLGDYGWTDAGAQFQWFMGGRIEELIENHNVYLDGRAVVLFWGISITSVFISILLPIAYLMRLQPKEILTISQEK